MEPLLAFLLLLPLFVAFGIGMRVFMGTMNHRRIRDHIETSGGRVVGIKWAPFGPGWFGQQGSIIYRVSYIDRDNMRHDAYCKTNFLRACILRKIG